MVYAVHSCALLGLEPHPVVCEVDLACQLPSFTLVGLPSSLTQESRDRIRAAVVNSGFDWPARKVTINLLPASLPKWGSHFELAMALGILGAASERPCSLNVVAIGELSLSGLVRPCGWLAAIAGWLVQKAKTVREQEGEPLVLMAHESDIQKLCAAAPSLAMLCELCDVTSLAGAFQHLNDAITRLQGKQNHKSTAAVWCDADSAQPCQAQVLTTLAAVQGEPLAQIAALVAIAGGYHCLFAGPHGMGKSMLIRAICEGTLPLSTEASAARVAMLSTFGQSLTETSIFNCARPTAYLQTSITRAALEGALLGSGQLLPGELTRAHQGILVADEFLELKRDVIEAFRQPLDEGVVRLQRAKFRTVLPARFQLLASANLCPCGQYGGLQPCRCKPAVRASYQTKLSGPILDRFDLRVIVGRRGRKSPEADIPSDLEPLVRELSQAESWQERIKRAAACGGEDKPVTNWSEVGCNATDRGRLKIARVAGTVAALLDEDCAVRHLRFAALLRQDFDRLLRQDRLKIRKEQVENIPIKSVPYLIN